MIIKEYGDNNLPKVVLLHPMLADGSTCMKLLKELGNDYFFIVPDFSAHGMDKSEFISVQKEAEVFIEYLKQNHYDEIELLFGASMGAVAALYVIADNNTNFKTIVVDGAPVYRNANLLYRCLTYIMLNKQKKAKKNPRLAVQKLKNRYGELGESMAASFIQMSSESIRNILWSCSHFDFPDYSEKLQQRIFFEFGDKDFYSRKAKSIQTQYPHVHVNVRKNYGHCEFLAYQTKAYVEMLKRCMQY
ncbi:alpha/beta fold hydrolase [Paenibacillus humicus]|uniref:alpha/beta fold hydrolase n=1 Tax=Paenibacillus humicus TaxID=412861 RepID=UPI003F14FE52